MACGFIWYGYISVADVDASVARLTAAGGEPWMPAMDVPGVGRIAMVRDPQGTTVYVMTPSGTGPTASFAPGIPGHCGWHELHARDWSSALAFYAREFGWHEVNAMNMGPLGTYQVPGGLWMFHARDPQGAPFALVGPRR